MDTAASANGASPIPSSSTFQRLPGIKSFRRDRPSTPPTHSLSSSHHSSLLQGSGYASVPLGAPVATLGRSSSNHGAQDPTTMDPPSAFRPTAYFSSDQDLVTRVESSHSGNDLEPIMYPAHLATTRPPPASVQVPVPGDVEERRQKEGIPILEVARPMPRAQVSTSSSAAPSDDARRVLSSRQQENDDDTVKRPSRRRATASRAAVVPEETRSRKHSRQKVDAQLPSAKAVTTRAPASAMYFSTVPAHGRPPSQPLRAHTGTLVGDRIWFLGGVDGKSCWREMAWFDTETMFWSTVETFGEQLPPLRAHSTTLVGKDLYVFGGGDGPTYSNDVWVFDTVTHRFSKPTVANPRNELPPPRRAHTTVLFRNFLVVFGGGNGQAALNDVWALDVSDPQNLVWHEWVTTGHVPHKKGYHTANLVGTKMIVFGGSDGQASFADVHVLDLETLQWTLVDTEVKHNRLSHTSTQVGSYLFVIGGHNGQTYAQDVLLFNLVTLQWESKTPRGVAPPGRGYHVAILHDARVYISGGYNGVNVFDDLWSLDLSAGAYLPQVTTFEVDEHLGQQHDDQ